MLVAATEPTVLVAVRIVGGQSAVYAHTNGVAGGVRVSVQA